MLSLLALAPLVVRQAPPEDDSLVLDLNTGPHPLLLSSSPRAFLSVGAQVVFTAIDADGRELWISDGTTAGTAQAFDLFAGPQGAFAFAPLGATPYALLPGGTDLLLAAETESAGIEPWILPSGASAPLPLGDLAAGAWSSTPEDFTPHLGELWFLADDGVHGRELWRTDGTAAGTQLAMDLIPGPDSHWALPAPRLDGRIASLGAILIYADESASGGIELWVLPPSSAPQSLGKFPGASVLEPFADARSARVGQRFVFAIESADPSERGVWSTDGTPNGTQRLIDTQAVRWMRSDGVRAYIATDPFQVGELHVTDGSLAGTQMLMGAGLDYRNPTATPGVFYQGALHLGAQAQSTPQGNLGSELVRTDGTLAGTQVVADLVPGNGSSGPTDLVLHQGALHFVGQLDAALGRELYRYDSANQSAQLVHEFGQGITPLSFGEYASGALPAPIASASGGLVLPVGLAQHGIEPWGLTPSGAQLLHDTPSLWNATSNLGEVVRSGTRLFFSAHATGSDFRELYALDLQAPFAAQLVPGPGDGTDSSAQSLLGFADGVVYLTAFDGGQNVQGLWWSDGAQSHRLHAQEFTTIGSPRAGGERLYWIGDTPASGRELYVSDGQPDSALALELLPGPSGSAIQALELVDERAYFVGLVPALSSAFALFVSDGTPASTQHVPLPSGEGVALPARLSAAQERLYFAGEAPTAGVELYVSDGTPQGTRRLTDIALGPSPSSIPTLQGLGTGCVFAYTSAGQRAVFHSDGTPGGLVQLLPWIADTSLVSGPMLAVDDQVYFPWGPEGEVRLVRSDGTPGGTHIVEGVGPHALEVSTPALLLPAGFDSLAIGLRGFDGDELWAVENDSNTPIQLADSWHGADSGAPFAVRSAQARLWFSAQTLLHGRELHAVELGASGLAAAESLSEGCGSAADGLRALDAPRIGQGFELELLGGHPLAPTVLAFDLNLLASTLPAPCQFGLPAPQLVLSSAADAQGAARYALALPADPTLVGTLLYAAGAVLALGEPFVGLASLSNVLEIVIGA